MQLPDALLGPNSKNRKYSPPKKSFHFREYNFLALRLNNFLYFRKLNPALLGPSSKNKKKSTPKKIPYLSLALIKFQETEIPEKNSQYFRKRKPYKSFLYSRKWNFSAQARKQKSPPQENFLYSNIKKFLIFSHKKAFLIFQ